MLISMNRLALLKIQEIRQKQIDLADIKDGTLCPGDLSILVNNSTTGCDPIDFSTVDMIQFERPDDQR